ncbi:potassium transporter KtrB [Mycoplasmopsis californica]|uniref:Potassium transporter KtrB n=1 Tax=Mycoplasmopsis californica TaxID=2113 RepID=A0A059XWB4_9BACT|nr:potassium transporter TrkG [Mycoplasmopsis californica]AIA29527.1 potassium transporter KtrB [Mycoplasmopsis californica]
MNKSDMSNRWRNSRFRAKISATLHWLRKVSNVRIIFFTYLLIVLASSLLLWSPITHAEEGKNKISYMDAIFTTASAFSDTGLVSVDSYSTWNMFGQAIIATLILSGGIGIFALKIFFISILFPRAKNSVNSMRVIAHERGSDELGTTKQIILHSVATLLIITFISGMFLSLYFYLASPRSTGNIDFHGQFISPKGNVSLAFRYGFFHTISAINNAGFDIIGQNSLMSYYWNIELQLYFAFLFLIGGLGYPVIYDITGFIKHLLTNRKNRQRYIFKLITKISVTTYLITTLIGFSLLCAFEFAAKSNSFASNGDYGNWAQKTWQLFFLSLSTRSAGFSTIQINHLTNGSIIVLTILMFIGAGPVSTGGGVRTTTIAILVLAIFNKILGRPTVRVFKRRIPDETVKMSSIVFCISAFLTFAWVLIISSSLDTYGGKLNAIEYNFVHLAFEVCSALGTSGLTVGVTRDLNIVSKIFLIIMMFIGQFGITSSVLVWGKKANNSFKYEYIQEEVMIG